MGGVPQPALESRIRREVASLTQDQTRSLAGIVQRLIDAYLPERIYLFGSMARGDAGPDSDYDLMVVVPDNASPERRDSKLAYQALAGTDVAVDVLVRTLSYFEARRHLRASLPGTILREGRLLYGVEGSRTTSESARAEDTRAWLDRALSDLGAVEHLLDASPPLPMGAAFHSQEAAEKALRAFLAWHDEPSGKTYDVEKLGRQALALDPELRLPIDRVGSLTQYAWKYFYPGEPWEPSEPEARDAVALAREVYQAIAARLPVEVRP